MAGKKGKKAEETPGVLAPTPAMLGADPADLDTEERRRLANQRRRYVRRRVRRSRWLDMIEERDPAYHAELLEWRRQHPQEYRKRLIRYLVKHGLYTDRPYTNRDNPAELMERLEEE